MIGQRVTGDVVVHSDYGGAACAAGVAQPVGNGFQLVVGAGVQHEHAVDSVKVTRADYRTVRILGSLAIRSP